MATSERTEHIVAEVEQGKSLIFVVGILGAIAAFIVLLTAPAQALLGDSAHAVTSALHGMAAGLFMITATVGLYLGYRLFMGQIERVGEIQMVTAVTAAFSLMTTIFGNWIYVGYRAAGGPREYFVKYAPEIHKIFFEFKEFIALFTLPLIVGAAFIAYYYGPQLLERPRLRKVVAITLALVFFYFVVAFGLGAAVTKLRPV